MRVGFLRVSFCAAFPLSFRANWKCQNGGVFGVLRASFFSRERERKDSADSRNLYARTALGRRERCDQNAREKKTTSRRVPFLSNEFDAHKEFLCARACVRAPKSSRGKRARVWQKTLCGDCFPLKKRKISWLLPLFFAPCALFFFFFGLVFVSFLAKNGGKFLSHSLGSWFFQVYYNTLLWTPPSLCIGRYFLHALETRL